MNQRQIEQAVGIDKQVAEYMMRSNTPQANSAMSLLKLAVDAPEKVSIALLQEAVKDCKEDINRNK